MRFRRIERGKRGRGSKLVSLLLLAVLSAASCGGSDDGNSDTGAGSESGQSGELQTVVMSMSTGSPYFYGYWLADELGFMEDEGIDIQYEITGGSSEAAAVLAANSADVAAASTSAFLGPIEQGAELSVFFLHTYGEPYDLLVPQGSDIGEVGDLSGKTLGITELQGGEVPLIRALIGNSGLDPDTDVNFLEVGTNPGTVQVAFDRGDIDAYAAAVSDVAVITASGRLQVESIMPEFVGQLPAGGLWAAEKNKDDRDMMIAVGRAAAKGHLVGWTNEEATICILREYQPEEFQDVEGGTGAVQGSMLVTTAPKADDGTYDFSAGMGDLEQWKDYIQLFVEGGVLEEPIDIEPLVVDVSAEINDFDQQEIIDLAMDLPTDC